MRATPARGRTCASWWYRPRCSCSTRLDTSAAAAAAGSEPSAAVVWGTASVLAALACMNLLSWAACSLKVKAVGATIMTWLDDCRLLPAHMQICITTATASLTQAQGVRPHRACVSAERVCRQLT